MIKGGQSSFYSRSKKRLALGVSLFLSVRLLWLLVNV